MFLFKVELYMSKLITHSLFILSGNQTFHVLIITWYGSTNLKQLCSFCFFHFMGQFFRLKYWYVDTHEKLKCVSKYL